MFLSTLVTILVIMDPIGNVPIFLSLTGGMSAQERNRSALIGTAVATAVIFTFALVGQQLLGLLGISLEALQVSGGLLLLLVSLELLSPGNDPFGDDDAPAKNSVAMVPLGTPLLAGPGSIAATMVATKQADGGEEFGLVLLALLVAMVVVFIGLRFAAVIGRIVTPAGVNLLSRVFGLLLAAISVQLVAEGIEVWVRNGVS